MAPHVMVETVAVDAIGQAKKAYESGDLRERLARYHADVDNAFWQWNDVWLSEAFPPSTSGRPAKAYVRRCWWYKVMATNTAPWRRSRKRPAACPRRLTCVLPGCGHSPHRDQPERSRSGFWHF
jgi:hypothetical protein